MSDEHDSWLSGIGVDVSGVLDKVTDAASSAASTVQDTASSVAGTAEGAASSAYGAAQQTASGVVQDVKGAAAGVEAAVKKAGPGAAVSAALPFLDPSGGDAPDPFEPLEPGGFPEIPFSGGFSGLKKVVEDGVSKGVEAAEDGVSKGVQAVEDGVTEGVQAAEQAAPKVVSAVEEGTTLATEGIAAFDLAITAGLVAVGVGVILGSGLEVKKAVEIDGLAGQVDEVSGKMADGYRTALQGGQRPNDEYAQKGWEAGKSIHDKMHDQLKSQNATASEEDIAKAIATSADHVAPEITKAFKTKAQEAVWKNYADAHQDTKWSDNLNERFRAWTNIYGSAPRGEKLWKDFLNEYSNMSNVQANLPPDKAPRQAPGAPNSGPATDPNTPQPAVAPGTPGGAPATDPNQPDPAQAPGADDDSEPLEFTAEKLPPTAQEFFDKLAKQKKPLIFRNLPNNVIEVLKAKYGPNLAMGLQERGTIASYEAMRIACADCGNRYNAHHIVEEQILKRLGQDVNQCPAVILTQAEHVAVHQILVSLRPGGIDDMTRQQIYESYKKAYKDHPAWMTMVNDYLR